MKLSMLLLFLSVSIWVMSMASNRVEASNPSIPIRVIAKTHVIDFPKSVTLKLEAVSDSPVRSIKIFYTVGKEEAVSIYGYPEFIPSKTVNAEFVIKTSGANHIPQGVVINYNYLIEDSEGRIKETKSSQLEYLDPIFNWERLTLGDLVILYHDRSSILVERALLDVHARMVHVRNVLMIEDMKPQKAIVMNSTKESRRNFPYISDRASRDHLYSGFAYGNYDLFLLVGLSRPGMIHEFTHLLLDEALKSPSASLPGWLNEGLAMYFESDLSNENPSLHNALQVDVLLPLSSMGSVPGKPKDVHLFYTQSLSLVNYLIKGYGENQISNMLQSIGNGIDVSRAFQETYGFSLEEFEEKWVKYIREEHGLADRNLFGGVKSSISLGLYSIAALVLMTGVCLIAMLKKSTMNH
ncbi:MAG: peptidase MA family metallohydrolase [Chloroflexota bacterium]|nr:peptidase MA family metallohydrolase [Chloroflexota bacterium]